MHENDNYSYIIKCKLTGIVVFSHHVLRNDGQLSLTAERFQQSHSDMQLKHPENHTKQ